MKVRKVKESEGKSMQVKERKMKARKRKVKARKVNERKGLHAYFGTKYNKFDIHIEVDDLAEGRSIELLSTI